MTPVGSFNRCSNLGPLLPSYSYVVVAETQAGGGGATYSGECAGEGVDSMNYGVHSPDVPPLYFLTSLRDLSSWLGTKVELGTSS